MLAGCAIEYRTRGDSADTDGGPAATPTGTDGGADAATGAPSCTDNVKNGDETDVDCGGSCPACASVAPTDPTCSDGTKNGSETDVDCGGSCVAAGKTCADGAGCAGATDCKSGVCSGGKCQPIGCGDGVKNGSETDVDCGGDTCDGQGKRCADGAACVAAADCKSGACTNGKCEPASCTDGVKNGTETDVDCGGSCADACADGLGCAIAHDCKSGVCTNETCQQPSCSDGVKNGAETDVDCGGAACDAVGKACGTGKTCAVTADCQSASCSGTKCQAPTFVSLVAGAYHNCALTSAGAVYCWGDNTYGQLGTTNPNQTAPMPVTLPAGVSFTQIAAGRHHTCGLTSAGNGYCWGRNDYGELGDGTTANSSTPKPVAMPVGVTFTQLAPRGDHTCALATSGVAYCWGDNEHGELGDGTNANESTPKSVSMPVGISFTQLADGYYHDCGYGPSGTAYCWGYNGFGELGDGTTTDESAPTAVAPPVGVSLTQLAAGDAHTCALGSPGPTCWGLNAFGQVGDGTTTNRSSPTPVSMPVGVTFTQLALGWRHTCSLSSSAAAFCWGYNAKGQLGDGTSVDETAPVAVTMPLGVSFTQIAAGYLHTCALTSTSALYCWGDNENGQLGDGTGLDRLAPTAVVTP